MANIKGVNLVVDSNYVLYRNVFWLTKTNTLYGDLEKSLEVSFDGYIHRYPFNKIYIVSDSKGYWRREIYSNYKQDRKQMREEADVDWEFVFNTFDKFKGYLDSSRVVYLSAENVEGDDLIRHVVEKSNSEGYSAFVIASDKDLTQLLDFRMKQGWMNIQLNDSFKNGKAYVPSGYKLFLRELKNDTDSDIFNLSENHDFLQFIKSLEEKVAFEEVDKEMVLFTKIISGDRSDCIESVLKTPVKSDPTKFQGIGDTGALKIFNEFKIDYPKEIIFEKDEWIKEVLPYVLKYKNADADTYETSTEKNIMINRRIIQLHENHLPRQIKETIKNIID